MVALYIFSRKLTEILLKNLWKIDNGNEKKTLHLNAGCLYYVKIDKNVLYQCFLSCVQEAYIQKWLNLLEIADE